MKGGLTRIGLAAAALGMAVPAAADINVKIELPAGTHEAGATFEVPVYAEDGAIDVASYALRIQYNAGALRINDIAGGIFPGFSAPPVADRRSFTSGTTDFTANNRGLQSTPDMIQLARIRFEVLKTTADSAGVALELSPFGGLVDGSDFGLVPAQFEGAGSVAIVPDLNPPAAPQDLHATVKRNSVNLTWTAPQNVTGYRVFRRLDVESDFHAIATTDSTAAADTIPRGSSQADYYVVADNEIGTSDPSATVTAQVATTRRRR